MPTGTRRNRIDGMQVKNEWFGNMSLDDYCHNFWYPWQCSLCV
jgi:hypothetical protein